MSENIKNEEVVEVNEVEVEVEKESKVKKVASKVGGFVSHHKKKIVAGVAIGTAGAVGYVLGKKRSNDEEEYEDDYEYDEYEDDIEDVEGQEESDVEEE